MGIRRAIDKQAYVKRLQNQVAKPTRGGDYPRVATAKLIKIKVTDGARKVIKTEAAALDMKEQGVASRVYEWFGQQDEVMRRHVLKLLPAGYEADILRLAMERAEAKRGKK